MSGDTAGVGILSSVFVAAHGRRIVYTYEQVLAELSQVDGLN